jgi:hypothetical protein
MKKLLGIVLLVACHSALADVYIARLYCDLGQPNGRVEIYYSEGSPQVQSVSTCQQTIANLFNGGWQQINFPVVSGVTTTVFGTTTPIEERWWVHQ